MQGRPRRLRSSELAGHQVAHGDAACHAVHHDQVEHLAAGVHLDRAGLDLAGQGGVGAQEQLLACLAAGVKGAGNLGAAEGSVVQLAGVFAGKRDALRHALVNDVVGHLGQTPDVGLTGAEIATLDGVVKETIDAVAVIRVVLGGVDAALGGDGVGAARAVLVAEACTL